MPAPSASGRTADVFPLDAHQVLRRYRDGSDATPEAIVMRYVGDHGFPVPAVYAADGADLVMERVDGPTMLAALVTDGLGVHEAAVMLANLHGRLHALPARLSTDPQVRILHLDLHPDNVIVTSRGPVVIDWRNTAEGPPELDVALTALIIAQVVVDDSGGVAPLADAFLTTFLACGDVPSVSSLRQASALRAADPNLTRKESGQVDLAAAEVRSRL